MIVVENLNGQLLRNSEMDCYMKETAEKDNIWQHFQ
jgi:hypothetical protein